MELATNVLGNVWMMQRCEGALLAAASARIVNVASYWAGDLDLNACHPGDVHPALSHSLFMVATEAPSKGPARR